MPFPARRWLIAFAALALAILETARPQTAACQEAPEAMSYEELYVRGAVAWATANYPETIRHLEPAARLHSGDEKLWYYLGSSYQQTARPADSIRAYQRAIEIRPDFLEAHLGLHRVYLDLGRREEALAALGDVIRIRPQDAAAHSALGKLYGELGRHRESADAFSRARALAPGLVEAYYGLAGAYRALELPQEERLVYRDLVAMHPADAMAQLNLGIVSARLGLHGEAVKAFRKAAELRRGFPLTHYLLGLSLSLAGDREAALRQHEILKKLDPQRAALLLEQIGP